MDIKKFFRSKKTMLYIIIFIVLIISTIIFVNSRNDGMKNIKNPKIYYRVHTEKFGYSKWTKNGFTSTKNDGIIDKIDIKVKSKDGNDFSFSVFNSKKGWIDENNKNNLEINAIKMDLYGTLSKKYSICYRVYNTKDKWFNWSCNHEINGNKNKSISAIQIKIIPKNGIKSEYLKDYIDNDERKNLNFE